MELSGVISNRIRADVQKAQVNPPRPNTEGVKCDTPHCGARITGRKTK